MPPPPRFLGTAVTAFPAATEAAGETIQAGGNAVDAAVAAAWALGVCEPGNSGLGGQTILLIRQAGGQTIVVDGHSQAPAAASPETVSLEQQRTGFRACTIPSTPAVLELAQQRFGRLPLARTLQPAIRLAEDGYRITALQNRQQGWCQVSLSEAPSTRASFLDNGEPYPVGSLVRQPALAATLRRIAALGADDFYRGELARKIVEDSEENGGLITAADLANGAQVTCREPITASYRDYDVVTVPPPAGGLQILLGLKMLEQMDLGEMELAQWCAQLGETVCTVLHEREQHGLNLDDFTAQQIANYLSSARAAQLVAGMNEPVIGSDHEEAGETTHLCTVDAEGNVVSLTQSIQTLFGAKVACAPCGFLYNNYLVTCPRERHPHQLASRCRPRSNAAPTLLLNKAGKSVPDRPSLVLGGAGSRRMTSAILQTISHVVDRGSALPDAIDAPRIHVKLSRNVWIEQSPMSEAFCRRYADRYASVELRPRHSYAMGSVQAIELHNDGTALGAADPRRDGTALSIFN